MSVLVDHQIRALCASPYSMIESFREEQLQSASYDVRLGNDFLVVDRRSATYFDLGNPSTFENVHLPITVPDDGSFLTLGPGDFVLGHTVEYVRVPDELVCRIEGRSSIGRLGLVVHATAGFVDPGFHGNLTLEIFNMTCVPIILRPGLSIAQLSFQHASGAPEHPYGGRYQGDRGVAPSRYM